MEKSKIKDPGLAPAGKMRVEWAESRMPVLMALREKHGKAQSLKGMRVAGCLHVTKETAVLVKTLVAAGAEVSWSGCNPLSTQDDVAAALAADRINSCIEYRYAYCRGYDHGMRCRCRTIATGGSGCNDCCTCPASGKGYITGVYINAVAAGNRCSVKTVGDAGGIVRCRRVGH